MGKSTNLFRIVLGIGSAVAAVALTRKAVSYTHLTLPTTPYV